MGRRPIVFQVGAAEVGLDQGVRSHLQKSYGITLQLIGAYFIVKLVWFAFGRKNGDLRVL